jgi:hypothetical protein
MHIHYVGELLTGSTSITSSKCANCYIISKARPEKRHKRDSLCALIRVLSIFSGGSDYSFYFE